MKQMKRKILLRIEQKKITNLDLNLNSEKF